MTRFVLLQRFVVPSLVFGVVLRVWRLKVFVWEGVIHFGKVVFARLLISRKFRREPLEETSKNVLGEVVLGAIGHGGRIPSHFAYKELETKTMEDSRIRHVEQEGERQKEG